MEGSSLKAAARQQPAQAGAVATQAQTKAVTPAARVKGFLEQYEGEITNALPKGWDTKRFIRIALTTISADPKLAQACALSPRTFIAAVMNSAQLGLETNTPMQKAFLVVYNAIDQNTGKKVPQIQFQIGYKGYMDLAYRSGVVKSISAEVRYEKDFWEYEKGLNQKMRHIPYDNGDPGPAVGYYAVIQMKDTINPDGSKSEGAIITAYMPKFRVLEHAKRFSKSFDRKTGTFSGPWQSDFDSMALKTVLLKALKFAPMASEDANLANAFNVDSTVRDGLEKDAATIKTEGVFAEGTNVSAPPYAEGETIQAEAEVKASEAEPAE